MSKAKITIKTIKRRMNMKMKIIIKTVVLVPRNECKI